MGRYVFGLGALILGLTGLYWGDFTSLRQHLAAGAPDRLLLADMAAGALAVGGIALMWRRTAPWGAAVLAALFALGVILLHAPHIAAHPLALTPWAGAAEQTALFAGAALAFALTANLPDAVSGTVFRVCWALFGVCCLVFGAVHFRFAYETAQLVPDYLPLGKLFWVRFTGAAHIAAGLALLSGIRARLAAQMLTAMFLVFAALVHAPLLLAHPMSHAIWVKNAMNLSLVGAAWIVADSLRGRAVWKWLGSAA